MLETDEAMELCDGLSDVACAVTSPARPAAAARVVSAEKQPSRIVILLFALSDESLW